MLGFAGIPPKNYLYINKQKFIKCFPVLLVLVRHCHIVVQQIYSLPKCSFGLLH